MRKQSQSSLRSELDLHQHHRHTDGPVLSHTIAKKIKETLESHITSEDDRKLLHQQDEDKTWFGILREDNGFPSFQDYGRYANLMAESSRSTMSSSGRGSGSRDSRYPSLVSFVGQTGKLKG